MNKLIEKEIETHVVEVGIPSNTNTRTIEVVSQGLQGIPGKSAYTQAVEKGFKGTEEEWLASLKGDPFTYSDFTPSQLAGLKGPKGDTGIHYTPVVNEDGVLSWTNTGNLANPPSTNIKGPKGDQGNEGIQGIQGKEGPVYTPFIDLGGNVSWTNNGNLPNPPTVNIKGPKGATGPSGRNATFEVGTVTTGEPGTDVSITNTGTTYAAKLNFTIPRGEKGEQGDIGLIGPQGIQGEKGDTGLKGDKGDPFKYSDFTQDQLEKLKGPKGDIGNTGPQGIQGIAGKNGTIFGQFRLDGANVVMDYIDDSITNPIIINPDGSASAVMSTTQEPVKIGRFRPDFIKEEWNASTEYPDYTGVRYQGAVYISVKPVPAGVVPTADGEYWRLFSARGEKGDNGGVIVPDGTTIVDKGDGTMGVKPEVLDGKADTSLANLTREGKSYAAGLGMPDWEKRFVLKPVRVDERHFTLVNVLSGFAYIRLPFISGSHGYLIMRPVGTESILVINEGTRYTGLIPLPVGEYDLEVSSYGIDDDRLFVVVFSSRGVI